MPLAESATKFRPLTPSVKIFERIVVISIALLGAAWGFELQYYLELVIFREQYLATIMTLGLVGVFIGVKARQSESGRSVPWYDWIAAVLSIVIGGYIILNYRDLVYDLGSLVTERYVLGIIAIVLALEATRRMTGWTLVILALVFMGYAKFSYLFPGMLNAPSPTWQRLATYLYLDSNGMLGVPLGVTATIIIGFILFGRTLYAVGGDRVLTDFALAAMGRRRGGPAKVAVIASSLFGTISGSAVSNVVMDGPITIPMMKRSGYPGHVAAAIEAVASTGGQIMPPVMGITAFLIAEFLAVPYGEVVLAAIIPAVLYYIALFIQVDLEAAKQNLAGLPADELPRLRDVARTGWVFIVPIVILVWTLIVEVWQPGRAAMAAVVATILVGCLQRATRPTWRSILYAVEETGRIILDLVVITLVAGLVIGAVQVSGLGFDFSLMLVELAGGTLLLLLLMTAAICIILGMGMPTGVIYVMLAVLVAPALSDMGVVPMAAHLFIFYFGLMSMVTPPVCLATFAAASIAQSDFWQSGWAGMRFAIVAYVVPFVMVYQPALLLYGTFMDVVVTTGKVVLGVLILSFGMVGYLFSPLGLGSRILFALSGTALMLVPLDASFGIPIAGALLVISAALVVWQKRLALQPA